MSRPRTHVPASSPAVRAIHPDRLTHMGCSNPIDRGRRPGVARQAIVNDGYIRPARRCPLPGRQLRHGDPDRLPPAAPDAEIYLVRFEDWTAPRPVSVGR